MFKEKLNILVIHGPNLNLLGEREPEVYGFKTLQDINAELTRVAESLSVNVLAFQSNHEGRLVDLLHEQRVWASGILINPAAFTHTSIALRDALLAIGKPFVEVHLSDLTKRESFRRQSFFSDIAKKTFMGERDQSYLKGLYFLTEILRRSPVRSGPEN